MKDYDSNLLVLCLELCLVVSPGISSLEMQGKSCVEKNRFRKPNKFRPGKIQKQVFRASIYARTMLGLHISIKDKVLLSED